MARKKKHEDHVNHEAWAIPYGDLVTLLLAFFVVMYAMSSVNEGKYRVLSDSLVAAFRSQPKSLEPIQVGQPSKARHKIEASFTRTLVPIEAESAGRPQDSEADPEELRALEQALGGASIEYLRSGELQEGELESAAELIAELTKALTEQLEDLVDEDLVRIRQDRYWLEIEINTSVLFDSASAELSQPAQEVLRRISSILADTPTRVQVEGHTDLRPIRTAVYPSNWELSSARAARVVRLFESAGMTPARMAAVGFGEYRPVADNDTPEGQARNRRIAIVVIAYQPGGMPAGFAESWAGASADEAAAPPGARPQAVDGVPLSGGGR